MDSLSTQKTKSRKMKKFVRKCRVQIIIDLFSRTMEIIVVLVTIAKLCHQLIIAFEDSCVAAVILANRNLAFVVGNAIVIALIAKSGLLLNQELDGKCKSNDVYEEFVRERSRSDGISRNRENQSETETQNINETGAKQSEAEKETQSISDQTEKQNMIEKKKKKKKKKQSISMELEKQSIVENQEMTVKEIKKQSISMELEKQSIVENQEMTVKEIKKQSISMELEKQSIVENQEMTVKEIKKQSISMELEKQSIVENQEMTVKEIKKQRIVEQEEMKKQDLIEKKQSQSYQRSRSENLEGLRKSCYGRLRRSETDVCSERFDSDDELRYKIESFIARQRRNQIDD